MARQESKYPSVTTVLSPFSDFSGIPEHVLLRASERGTTVHQHCESIAKGEWIPAPPAEAAGYIESFRWWFEKFVDEVLLVEEELVDEEMGFLGHPDLIVRSKALGGVILVDEKTPLNLNLIWGAQLAGYRRLANVRGILPHRIGSLRLSPVGLPPKFEDYSYQPVHWHAFYCCLQAYKFFVGAKP